MAKIFSEFVQEVFAEQGIDSKKPWAEQSIYDWIWIKYSPVVENRREKLLELKAKGLMPKDEEIPDE